MELNLEGAVDYHYDKFPPGSLDFSRFIEPLVKATDAVARYDQMLKNMYNSEILLAPLRNQEAVISSRMEGTVSTMDEILEYEANFGARGFSTADHLRRHVWNAAFILLTPHFTVARHFDL